MPYLADPAQVRKQFVVRQPLQPFAPAAFGGVMAVLTHVPRPIFRKLPF